MKEKVEIERSEHYLRGLNQRGKKLTPSFSHMSQPQTSWCRQHGSAISFPLYSCYFIAVLVHNWSFKTKKHILLNIMI